MKKINKIFAISAVVMTAGVALQSCQSEAPFSTDGEGLVRLSVDVNSRVTRAVEGEEELRANARIYISNDKGVLNKWIGTENIPTDGIYLRYGSYVAEAMAGDSVPASFESKFFKGATEFTVDSEAVSQVAVTCRIANVVASIDESTIDSDLIKDVVVEIGHTKGALTYAGENIMKPGYFMMPSGVTSLEYKISAVNSKDKPFTKTGVIENVLPAHDYRLKFHYNPSESDNGGAFLTITIVEENLVEEDVVIYGKPAFSWVADDPALDSQIIGTPGGFTSKTLRVGAYQDFKSLTLSSFDSDVVSVLGQEEYDIYDLSETGELGLKNVGILVRRSDTKDELCRFFIEFTDKFLNSFPARDSEYVLTVKAVDVSGKDASYDVRIANTEAAIVYADPIIIEFEDFQNDFTSVSARSVTIPVNITDVSVENPALQYRKSGESAWTTVPVNSTRAAGGASVRLTGLAPATAYQFRVVAGAFVDGAYEFESEEIGEFTTEGEFAIPNASFEDWSTYNAQTMLGKKDVILPFANGDKLTAFWGSGNEGAATANKVLTNKSTDMINSGTYSARLASDAALGIIAAGNIFTGYYVKTDGTNGVLSVGKEYNGSHPSKLRVFANYRPGGSVTISDGNEKYVDIVKNGTDQGQIYVALTTEPIEIRTNPNNRKLFDKNGSEVLAYGEVTWKEAFGTDGSLQLIDIPLEYNDRAKTVKPTHLVIVCSASKFGDYFCGSSKSVMYVDDFELVYE